MGCLKYFFACIQNFIVFFLLVILLPGLPPKTDFPFSKYTVESPAEFTGPLAINNHLDNAERLLEGRLNGPEHLIKIGEDIYTGLTNGEIIRINSDRITRVTSFGGDDEGRPLGLAYDAARKQLIVADSAKGVWEVDLKDGAKKRLVGRDTVIQGENPRTIGFINSVSLASNGDVFFTDSSSEFGVDSGVFVSMANPSGRLIHFDRKRNVATALIDEVAMANGLLISPDEDFIVLAELQRARILKYHLRGSQKGTWEPFISGLPGHPDNLTPSSNGFWIPLVISRDSENPSLMASLGQVPLVRKFLLRVLYLIELPFKMLYKVYPNEYLQKFINVWGDMSMVAFGFPERQILIKADWSGKIIGALHGTDRSVHIIGHVTEDGDYLYLGSPMNNYIGRVKLNAAAKQLLKMEEKPKQTTTPKPETTTTTTPKPPTTTPKPPPASTTAKPPVKEQEPAPVHEKDPKDSPPPPQEKLKIIKKGGVEGEL